MDTSSTLSNSISSSSSTSSTTTTSSSSPPPLQPIKTKVKRTRRNFNPEKSQFGASPGRRSSMYRGVTRHRWTGRYEAHLWDKSSWNPVQNKKGRQVYLGAYDDEEAAAHTYDLAALKYWGPDTILNFPLNTYVKEYEEMQMVSKEEYLASLRRRSSGFSRGVSKYRGVARHHHNGRWEARIGRVFGNKYLYLGTYSTQEEAAAAYDMAAIEYRGINAVTNFDISHYIRIQPPPQPPQPYSYQDPQQIMAPAPQIQLSENPNPMDQAAIIDPLTDQSWNLLCMDPAYNAMTVPDIALDKSNELHDLFSGTGFEDNIELLFDVPDHGGGTTGDTAATGRYEIIDQVSGGTKAGDLFFENSSGFEEDFLNDIEEGLILEENLNPSVDSINAYTLPISICS